MKKQVANLKQEVDTGTLNLFKGLCSRMAEAFQEIDSLCTEQSIPKPEPSSLGAFQGIGLYAYIKNSQQQLKKKFPVFTQNQILCILLAQWQGLSNNQKVQFCSKLDLDKFSASKKMRKLNKQGQKLLQSIQSSSKNVQIQSSESSLLPRKTFPNNNNIQKRKQTNYQIQQEQSIDEFFDQQRKKDQTPVATTKNMKKQFQIQQCINQVISNNLNNFYNFQNQNKTSDVIQSIKQNENKGVQAVSEIQKQENLVIQPQFGFIPLPSIQSFDYLNSGGNSQCAPQKQNSSQILSQNNQNVDTIRNEQPEITFGKCQSKSVTQDRPKVLPQQTKLDIERLENVEQTPVFPNPEEIQIALNHQPATIDKPQTENA